MQIGATIVEQLVYTYDNNQWSAPEVVEKPVIEAFAIATVETQLLDGVLVPVKGTAGLITPEEKLKLT